VVVVTPPEVVVRRDESEVKDEPRPLNEDEDVFDPAVAVVCDPVAELLEASAEHGVIVAADAVPGADAAAVANATIKASTSVRRAPFSQGNIRGSSFRPCTDGVLRPHDNATGALAAKGAQPGRSRTLQHSQEAGVCVRQAALQRLTGVVDEIGTIRRRDRLGSAVDAELADDVLEVRRDGLRLRTRWVAISWESCPAANMASTSRSRLVRRDVIAAGSGADRRTSRRTRIRSSSGANGFVR
jgi:hypothetical protein